ncbi:MAG: hypothetical protein ABIY70_20105 [Capsulimonas sp.]|uniref:hypothetical protein n=1 Tax=Capsulimonas sp. TaxID=2494211 RepID=UPI00326797FA
MPKQKPASPKGDIPNEPSQRRAAGWALDDKIAVDVAQLTKLAVAIWRIDRRAQRAEYTPEPVKIACESALERLADLEIRVEDLIGHVYHDNLRVNVVEQIGTQELRITECLSPAVYIQGQLTATAAVVVTGADAQDES